MFLLKIQWELFGLKAPAFSWTVSICLIVYSIFVYETHRRASRNRQYVLAIADKRLKALRGMAPVHPGEGIARWIYDSISSAFDDLPLLQAPWQAIVSCIVVTDRDKENKFWVSEDIEQIVAATTMVDSQSYRTAPTVISGVGLLATFLAILVALLDVKLAQNRVQGLDLLVQGLSGKFLSSVVALSCATMLIYAEKGLSRPCAAGIASLAATLKGLLPRLVPTQILSDLHREMAAQAKMLGAFNVDLKGAVKDGLKESIGPALESLQKMAAGQEELNRFVREEEARKQEAMNERLSTVLQDFGQSLGTSLDKMAAKFDEALALNTHGQFGLISESLANAATLLQQINEQLVKNQYVLIDLVDLARNTTAGETAARQAQTEQLTNTVNELMARLQEKTGESMTSIDTTLAAITFNISDKVMELSTQMAAVIRETSEKSTSKAKEVMDQAGSLSSQSALRLAELLERHGAEMTRVEDLKNLLDSTIRGFVTSIDKYGHVTEGLQKVTSQVNTGIASLSQTVRSIKESQEGAARISVTLSDQIESMRGFSHNQREVWDRIQGSMVEYEKLFGSVEGHAGEMLGQIARHLEAYSEATEKHFSSLASAADSLVSQATGRLSGSIMELSEQLDDLHAALGGMARMSQVRS